MSLRWEGCPSSHMWFQETAWQNSLWIWLKARLIEFWYVIKSSNKSAQIPVQPTIQHSWAPQANYDEVIISAKGSALNGSFVQRVESPPLTCSTLRKGHLFYRGSQRSHKSPPLGRSCRFTGTGFYFKAGCEIKRYPWNVSDAPDASSHCNYHWY